MHLDAALLALVAAFGPAVPGKVAEPRAIHACLTQNFTRKNAPRDLHGLVRRFPDGQTTRDLAWWPEPVGSEAGTNPVVRPHLQLVYGIEGSAATSLKQLSISGMVIFDDRSPETAAFELLLEGVSLGRVPWTEYATAARGYRGGGAPRYVAVEKWLVWGERGAALARLLEAAPARLEVRLVDGEGLTMQSATYDLSLSPLDDPAAVANQISDMARAPCGFPP